MAGGDTNPDDTPAPDEAAAAPDATAVEPALEARIAGARPAGDPVARAVWFSRVAGALFGKAKVVSVGRYQIRRALGRGGGGAVFAAWDPELRRDVAVKLIECPSPLYRERAAAEAQALARLSHPNVVAVHDVGEHGDHVYLVMELLRGDTLRGYAAHADRTLRELVTAYRQAASGLAAAHAAGLVHRDFKPDNALFGEDGRLRLVDFGLAVDPAPAGGGDPAPARGAVGTPRYMAPEQRGGQRITHAADQYALAAALREAISQRDRGIPAWLARVLDRALAEAPGDRYPTIDELARALGTDPRARWRRRAVVVAPIALVVAGFAVGRGVLGTEDACTGAGPALAPAWTRARVAAAAARVATLGSPFATASAPLIRERATGLGEAWLAAHHRSCTQHRRGELSHELYDRATVCLARSRAGLGEVVRLLEHPVADQLPATIQALASIDPPEHCTDPAALVDDGRPRPTPATLAVDEQIEAAHVLARAATRDAVERGRAAVAAARATGDATLLARALLVAGQAEMAPALATAIEPLHEAMLLAIRHRLDDIAVEAYARYVFARARTAGTPTRALDHLDIMAALAERGGEHAAFAHALLYNNAGTLALAAGDRATARGHFEHALRLSAGVTGPGAVELLVARSNLALVTPDAAERARLYDDAVARALALVGPDHPLTLYARIAATLDLDDPREVVVRLVALCPRLAEMHPTLADRIHACAFELAWQAFAIGDADAVKVAARVPSDPGDPGGAQPLRVRLVRVYAALVGAGEPIHIAELEAAARAETDELAHAGWSQHVYAADAELALASAAQLTGDRTLGARAARRAADHLAQAIAGPPGEVTGTLAQQPGEVTGMLARRLARAHELGGEGRR